MKQGDAFLMGSPGGQTKHLWFVLSDPGLHEGFGVIVNLTSNRERSGGECRISPGDHPWVTKECWVGFGDAQEITPAKIAQIKSARQAGYIIEAAPLTDSLLSRVQEAAKLSSAFPQKFKNYLAPQSS